MNARIKVIGSTDKLILIRDESRTYNSISITNDAEAVVEHLHSHSLSVGKTIFYIDTYDRVDILKHDNNGEFTGFKCGYDTIDEFYENNPIDIE